MIKKAKFKILIADDDEDILLLLKYILKKDGYKVKVTNDASEVLNLAETFNPHLIILDIMMPEVNGLDICKELRSYGKFNNTLIFFLTARSDFKIQKEASVLGANDFIEKMNGIRTLKGKINEQLGSLAY